MAARLSPATRAVEIWHDGTKLIANAGEPLAFALIAADRIALARSPKLHRPRGPYCLAGACDGCLARVDGVPNVMTCMRRAAGGEQIETQNVIGSRGTDLLRASDFLFPKGIDHHQLFAGVPIISDVVQAFARRVAGLGELPDEAQLPREARKLSVEVAVVGGGRSGLTLAEALRRANVGSVHLFDDKLELGANLRLLWPERAQAAVLAAQSATVVCHPETTIVGLFESPGGAPPTLLATNAEGATLVSARAIVLATGSSDRTLLFGNNDLPGVFSARAALALLRAQISIGPRVLLVDASEIGRMFEQLAADQLQITHATSDSLLSAKGSARVSGARFRDTKQTWRGEAIVIDGPRPSALQLAIQAGFAVEFSGEAYRLVSTASPSAALPPIWITGSAAESAGTQVADTDALATAICHFLGKT